MEVGDEVPVIREMLGVANFEQPSVLVNLAKRLRQRGEHG
jgi:hypothetical protein